MAQNKSTWAAALLCFIVLVFLFVKNELLRLGLETQSSVVYFLSSNASSVDNDKLARLGLTKKKPVTITDPSTGTKKKIYGRFLHVTDFHPDPLYKEGSLISDACHKGRGDASKYGDAIMGCDSPLVLVEQTIQWIEDNLKGKIDFIVWTGDNMRHDNDRQFPRTEIDIFALNEQIANVMLEKFGTLPIPSLGNNDVYPHNLFAVGPTFQTREFYKLWRPFVPQSQMHIFNQGVYYFQEVIPNHLAVLSINTLYLFQSNPLVDSCDRKKDPGYKLFLWLGFTLKELRKRNMKVWLTGHVPPNAKNYDISCLRKYILWSHEYRDVIIGGLYGHMNIDHFIPLDSVQAYRSMEKKFLKLYLVTDVEAYEAEDIDDILDQSLEEMYSSFNASIYNDNADDVLGFEMSFRKNVRIEGGIPANKVEFMNTVRESMYATLKGKAKSGDHGERYSIAHVNPSVIPTFNPSLRVWEYNITELYQKDAVTTTSWDSFLQDLHTVLEDEENDPFEYLEDDEASISDIYQAKKKKKNKRDRTIPPKMPKDKKLGPAYTPQLFTPERYVQYYLDLKAVNSGEKPFEYEIEYTTDKDYKMKDLTVLEWLKFGRKLGKPVRVKNSKDVEQSDMQQNSKGMHSLGAKATKLWAKFLKHSFVSTDYENSGYG